MKHIKIQKFGPIDACDVPLKAFNILTGAQATGKSTLAKAVFFCDTLGQEIFDEITMHRNAEREASSLLQNLEKRLRFKFFQMFGPPSSLSADMEISYDDNDESLLKIHAEKRAGQAGGAYVSFVIGAAIQDFLIQQEMKEYVWDKEQERTRLREEIRALLKNPYRTIYVPAGRSTITLLTDKIATILDDANRSVDYCMKQYIRQTTELRSAFRNGTQGLLEEMIHTAQTIMAP